MQSPNGATLRRLLDCAFICNNAKIEQSDADYRVIGDPTEGALICLAEKAGVRGMHQRLHLNPFESIRKRMSVVVKPYRQVEPTIYVKGARWRRFNNAIAFTGATRCVH